MNMHANFPVLVFLLAMLSTLTLPLAFPYASAGLWRSFINTVEHRRAMRRERISRELDARLKKYWVIDMRKLL